MSARDPGPALLRAIVADAAHFGVTAADATITTHDWASATFVGHRHHIVLAIQGDAATWCAHLPHAQWQLPGHIVADMAVERHDAASVALSTLTLRDC